MNTDQLRGLERLTFLDELGSPRLPKEYIYQGDYAKPIKLLYEYESLVPALLAERDALQERCEAAEGVECH